MADSILQNNTDIFIVTETWFAAGDDTVTARFCSSLHGFTIHQVPRIHRKGGGTAVIVKANLQVTLNKSSVFKTFEILDANVRSSSVMIRLIVIYRPPNSCISDFLTDFSKLMEGLIHANGHLIIVGDFNIHVDNPRDHDALKFVNILNSFGLEQHVNIPTHDKGHTLDLIITRASDASISTITSDWLLPSDHSSLHFDLMYSPPQQTSTARTSRKISSVNIEDVKDKLSPLISLLPSDDKSATYMADNYNTLLRSVIDDLAPLVTKYRPNKQRAPWYTFELLDERRKLRRLERQLKSTGLVVHKDIFKAARSAYVDKLRETQAAYHREKIQNADQKSLFTVIDDIIGNKRVVTSILPDIEHSKLPDVFAEFFQSKIEQIRRFLPSVAPSDVCNLDHSFSSFTSVSIDFVSKLINTLPSKSCSVDPIPTVLLKSCCEQVVPAITQIINKSLLSGEFPQSCKTAIIRPLLKKSNLDSNVLRHYRPVSNLPFLSKLIERTVFNQLNAYLCHHNLFAKCQSAYRTGYSTETALLRVQNDILRSLDKRKDVILILLDLSAAFDTIDHNILLHRLYCRFGITGSVLNWFKSYLLGRTQSVCVGSVVSEARSLNCGVPQGSVLGPILFNLYTAPLEDILFKHKLDYMMYADDTQSYITCEADRVPLTSIELCIDEIRRWMRDNMLSLNDGKTEVIHFSSKFRSEGPVPHRDVRIGDVCIHPSDTVRNLGVTMHSTGAMSAHVSNVCKSASHALWKIGKIRNLLDQRSTEKLIHAFITSRLDYCNSLLYNLPAFEIRKLQTIQNSAARLVTRTRKSDHITPVLRDLHWLPVQQRIEFKILCITFKVLCGLAPSYLDEVLTRRSAVRTLRSHSNGEVMLHQPIGRTAYYGDRAFSICAPRLWNSLPSHLRSIQTLDSFKVRLKTHLFKSIYI